MPLRPSPPLRRFANPSPPHAVAVPRSCCSFSTTAARLLNSDEVARKNHYERLHISHDASPAEIKKSFYKLSKVHHPDANPNDPSASHTFSLLSESYTVLSDPPRRAAYDRDHFPNHHHHHGHSHHAAHPKGSYHSAGGRPASGLSKRRGTFRGPPPSFYRSGGYGAHTDKRRRAHEDSTASNGNGNGNSSGSSADSQHGGMGPGSDPFGHHEEVPHFDKQGHERTHRREDQRRWQRTRRAVDEDNIEFEPQMSVGAHFTVIIGLLLTSFAVPALYLGFGRSKRKKKNGQVT